MCDENKIQKISKSTIKVREKITKKNNNETEMWINEMWVGIIKVVGCYTIIWMKIYKQKK